MQLHDQIKTPQGQIPTARTRIVREEGMHPVIEFTFKSPEDIARASRLAARSLEPPPSLEDLSVIAPGSVEDLARRCGPLFGGSTRESVLDWQDAAEVARITVLMQQAVNGTLPLEAIDDILPKTVVRNTETGSVFSIMAATSPLAGGVEGSYVSHMPSLPWFRKFGGDDCYEYVFIACDEDEDGEYLATLLLSFESEITTADFLAVLRCFFDENAVRDMLRTARGDVDLLDLPSIDDGTIGLLAKPGALSIGTESLEATDLEHIQKLIHAIISLHLQRVTLDVFRSSEGDDFLTFDTYLSYLWYSFSRKLGQVKIGLCEVCGKGFSLTGHRGIKRRFCSEECKTKAKNQRRKEATVRVREMFAEGMSVAQIAAEVYPKDAAVTGEKKVRALLGQWVELKHRLAAEAAAGENRPLALRCAEEGVHVHETGGRR